MTYAEAIRYLESFINYEKLDGYDYNRSFKLERMVDLAAALGDPHKAARSIHIAGTKGKGSTASFVHSILNKAGFKAGLYTSPHLETFRERIRIDDELISEGDLSRIVGGMKDVIEKLKARPSFFEAYTALGFIYFKEKKVDFAVYEVGLGGRLDATNIISPLVSAITPVSYDHTDRLGSTLREIASEKAAIIKPGGICVSAPQEAEALAVIKDQCGKMAARLIIVGEHLSFKEIESTSEKEVFNVSGLFDKYERLETTLLGTHQVVNAATAIGAIEALRSRGINISKDAIREGIRETKWAGRLEIIAREPLIVLDGAQNRASARALADAVKKIFKGKRMALVLGVSKDKDVTGILDELLPLSDRVILTKANVPGRAKDPEELLGLIKKMYGREAILRPTVKEALAEAMLETAPEEMIMVAGSLFLVGQARELLLKKQGSV